MIFKVTKKFGTGSEQLCRQFKALDEAKLYAYESAAANAALKIKVIYRVYEFDDIMLEVDSAKLDVPEPDSIPAASDGSSGGISSGATFKPTPFAMAPLPKGMPQKWLVDPDSDKKDEK